MDFSVGDVIGDRYQVEGHLGEGGMAVVYQVRHVQLGTPHALKVLTLTSRSVRDRMLQEGRFQARLRHPNIVAVTDVVAVHESPALVMELIDGPPLDELLRMQKLTLDQADGIARGLLAAVAHAHERGVVHRDLKPANVLLEIVGQRAIPKVTDFGLAKLLDGPSVAGRAATRTGSTMGTPQYMSPEQIKDAKNVDQRTDVFALGAILYELVTGDRAFDGDHVLDIFKAIDDGVYVDPSTLRPDATPAMLAAIEAGLRGDRDARAQSAAELFALWTGGEELPTEGSTVPLGSLPSLAEFRTRTDPHTAPDAPSAPSTSVAAPLMLGGSVLALLGAAAVIAVLLSIVGWLWLRPARPRVVEVPVPVTVQVPTPVQVATPVQVVDVADPPVVEPAEPAPPDPPIEEGVPWGEDPTVVRPSEPVDAPAPRVPEEERLAERFLDADDTTARRALGADLLRSWRDGPEPIHEPLAAAVLEAVPPDRRPLFLAAYGARGTSVQPLAEHLDGERAVAKAAAEALVAVARRQDTVALALEIVDERAGRLGDRAVKRLRLALLADP
jgi:serine/threonine-protein kinase